MRDRAFTLLELIIALSLVLAMAAVAVAVMTPLLDERRFDSAVDKILNQLRLARAHAQLEGRMVEVVFASDSKGIVARYFDPDVELEDGGGLFDGARDGRSDGPSRDIAAGWAADVLGRGFTLGTEPPQESLEGLDDAAVLDALEQRAKDRATTLERRASPSADELIRLVVYVPDGSALLTLDTWLSDADGRVGRLSVNPFTGQPRFERLEDIRPPADVEPESEDDESAEDEPSSDEARFEPPDESPDAADPPATDPPDEDETERGS